jgi:pantothenate synthetase
MCPIEREADGLAMSSQQYSLIAEPTGSMLLFIKNIKLGKSQI